MAFRRSFADQEVKISRLPAFRAEHFPYSGPYPWLDLPDAAEQIEARVKQNTLSESDAALCRHWAANGYVILDNLIEAPILDEVWEGYKKAVQRGKIKLPPEPAGDNDPYPGRYLNPHKKVGAFCQLLKHAELMRCIRLLMEREPKPLQTIASHKGTQQGLHSDSIHMTTYPLGYLTAAWIALEDIHPDSGPLVYYPGSHRLPYVFSKEVGISEDDFKTHGYAPYHARYEPYIRGLVEQHQIEPAYFNAKKGDVLIWHANLIHGGSTRANLAHSRKSVVCHFFVKNAFVYHDLAAAQSKQQYLGTCLLRDEEGTRRLF
jgi:hypothetical protein